MHTCRRSKQRPRLTVWRRRPRPHCTGSPAIRASRGAGRPSPALGNVGRQGSALLHPAAHERDPLLAGAQPETPRERTRFCERTVDPPCVRDGAGAEEVAPVHPSLARVGQVRTPRHVGGEARDHVPPERDQGSGSRGRRGDGGGGTMIEITNTEMSAAATAFYAASMSARRRATARAMTW